DRHVAHLRNLDCATVYVADVGSGDLSLGDVLASKVRERATLDLGQIYHLVGAALAPARGQSVEQLAAEVASGELGRAVGRLVDRAAVDRGLARVLDDLLATEI